MTTEELEIAVEAHERTLNSMFTLFEKTTKTLTSLLEAANLLKAKVEILESKLERLEYGPAS